jgi:transcription initiation factor TFIIA large subunit
MHPSLPQPVAAAPRAKTPVDSEAINSDLDDSDTEGEEETDEGGAGESDIVFCTYDKVCLNRATHKIPASFNGLWS